MSAGLPDGGTAADFSRAGLLDGEIIEDLQRAGLKIIRAPGTYAYTADSVLLADFARVKKGDRVCDLGAGDGILPLLLCGRCREIVCDGVERDAAAVSRAGRSALLNGLSDRIHVHCATFERAGEALAAGAYTLAVSNPPYFRADADGEKRAPDGTLNALAAAASRLLRARGRFALCFPAGRLAALLSLLCGARLEPKEIRFVYGKPDRNAYLCLIRCVKDARPGLTVAPPLYLRGEDGRESAEIDDIYGREGTALLKS